LREAVLRDLAARAASDPGFLSGIRKDPQRTLAAHGYDLTPEELKAVLDLRRRTALLGDRTLAALLAGGLGDRQGGPPVRPASPGGPGRGPARPGFPGGTGRKGPGGDQPG
jgi:hypothetical protein